MAGAFDVANALLNPSSAKKKKRYIIILMKNKSNYSTDLRTVERAIQSSLKNYKILHLDDPDEGLKILLVKNVEIIIIEDGFLPNEEILVNYAYEAKSRKKCPIFFLTNNENKLINAYRKKMFLYEEMDDYFPHPVDFVEVGKRLKRLSLTDSRSSKRFVTDIPVAITRIVNDERLVGTLTDISLVGFGAKVVSDRSLERLEQLRMELPLHPFGIFHPEYGEILKIAGRIRRTALDGLKIGCSIEFMTPKQLDCLTQILAILARRTRGNNASKALQKTLTEV